MKTKKIMSDYFGYWTMKQNGLQQHGITAKEFLTDEGYNRLMLLPEGTKAPRKQKKKSLNHLLKSECWYDKKEKYKVVRSVINSKDHPELVHSEDIGQIIWLSVRIHMGEEVLRDWREFQCIKNDLVGKEAEAIEIYPPESMLVDEINTFHLWVFPKKTVPLGWVERKTLTAEERNFNDQR